MNTSHLSSRTPLSCRIGWIPYWNLWPLGRELSRSSGVKFEFVSGHPAQVNQWLSSGQVSMAPCSSVNLLRQHHLDFALPLGVASDGPVKSVYLGFPKGAAGAYGWFAERLNTVFRGVDEVSRYLDVRMLSQKIFETTAGLMRGDSRANPKFAIQFSTASATSVALAKLCLTMINANFENGESSGARPLEVVIGDEALERRSEFSHVIDLGELWKRLTGLPFVFAVWQASPHGIAKMSPLVRQTVLDAAAIAQARMRVDASVYFPDTLPKNFDLAEYWDVIQYRLGAKHVQSLLLFFCLLRQFDCEPQARGDEALSRIVHWQEFANRLGHTEIAAVDAPAESRFSKTSGGEPLTQRS